MNNQNLFISVSLHVSDIDQALATYVEKWKLFSIVNRNDSPNDSFVMLAFVDAEAKFQLILCQNPERKTIDGNIVPVSKTCHITLPKTGFWQWVNDVLKGDDMVEETPWCAYVCLRDPFGHMLTIQTQESPDSDW